MVKVDGFWAAQIKGRDSKNKTHKAIVRPAIQTKHKLIAMEFISRELGRVAEYAIECMDELNRLGEIEQQRILKK